MRLRSQYSITDSEHKLDILDMLLENHLNLACSDNYGFGVIYDNSAKNVEAVLNDITGSRYATGAIMDIWLDCNESGRYCIEAYMREQTWAVQDRLDQDAAIRLEQYEQDMVCEILSGKHEEDIRDSWSAEDEWYAEYYTPSN